MATTNAILQTVGTRVIDKSIVPYMHAMPILTAVSSMRPGAVANIWMDDVSVNPFVQAASHLTANIGFVANILLQNEGLYCNTTHAYAEVMETSTPSTFGVGGGHYIYLSENFLSLNLTPYGPANSNSFAASNYKYNELVYQANNTANIYANNYVGRVVYWQPTDGSLHLQTLSGTISNTSGARVLYRSGSTQLANVVSPVMGNKFPNGATVTSVLNVNAIFSTTAWYHTHGLIANVATLANQIQLSGTVGSNAVNSIFQFVSGTGVGQNAKIISISGGGLLTLNTTLLPHTGNTYYAIGGFYGNHLGYGYGWFHVPEDRYFNFQTGYRLITFNDAPAANSNAATMRSHGTLAAVGQIAPHNKIPVVPKPPIMSPKANTTVAPSTKTTSQQNNNQVINDSAASADPLVQTFFTPKPTTSKIDNGIFATSVDLFFASKPSGNSTHFPVHAYIVEVVNGFPTSTILATSSVRWEGVQTTDGVHSFPSVSNTSTNTHFVFDDPLYLAPGTEYGLVVYSESGDYYVWVADLGQKILNSTRLVSPSPYIGSFFKSQNATAWTPIQNRSLMFNLNKAVFSTTPVNMLFNLKRPLGQNTFMDTVLLHSSDLTFPPANIAYGIKTYNANTGARDANFFTIFNNTPFSFGGDLSTSTISSNRRRIMPAGNTNGVLVNVNLATTDPDVSPFFHSERLSFTGVMNFINAGGLSNTDISIVTPGNHLNAANIVVTIGPPLGDYPIQATANVLANGLSGNSVISINMINNGAGYDTSPTITITEAGAPSNATAVVNGEDGISGGNGYARYITRQITLADGFDSGDIKVFLTAVRPQGTDIQVYYKVLGASDPDVLTNKNWVLMTKQADIFSPDQVTPIDMNYNTGYNSLGVPNGTVNYVQGGVQYPIGGKFKSFALKVVLFANDPTVPPFLNNIRAIAVPSG